MKRLPFILGIILGFCLISPSSWAAKAYVTDIFKVTLRTGPSIENKIIAMLSSGQEVEVFQSDGEWSRVVIHGAGDSTREGWMLTKYLVDRLPWEAQARSLTDENATLREKLKDTQRELNEALRREQELTDGLKAKTEALQESQQAYESLRLGAGEYLTLKAKHEAALSTLNSSEKQVRRLTDENERLNSSQHNKWFATGALVLLCGLMIGLTIGRQQKRRRSMLYQ